MSKLIIIASFAIPFLNACNFSDDSNSLIFSYGECVRENTSLLKKPDNAALDEFEKIAILTISEGKTYIHLTSVSRSCDDNSVKIKANKTAVDTLKIEEYFSNDNSKSKCAGCSSSMDLTLEFIDNDIEYVVYGEYQVFPARYE